MTDSKAFPDLFSDKAEIYAAARPTYPDELFRFVASIAPANERAWDCACGNGQAAVGLARHFRTVEASDASREQIAHAIERANVRYSVQPAEHTDFAPGGFDAVCVAQALHWFDFDAFYAEVRRVRKPGGVFVGWGYAWFTVDPNFDRAFAHSVLDTVRPYWAPQNQLVWNGYRDVPFPFAPIAVPRLRMELHWTLPQLLAYVHSWSAVRRCMEVEGDAFFRAAAAKLATVWGDRARTRRVSMDLSIRAGK